jgi:hypothetical protein
MNNFCRNIGLLVVGFVFCAYSSVAKADAPMPNGTTQSPAQQQSRDIQCSQAKLTQEKFLDMLYAIAMHGDMTDVPFLEKTLELKFTLKGKQGTEKNPDQRSYAAETLLGGRMRMEMGVGFNSSEHTVDQEPKGSMNGAIRFFPENAIFHDCGILFTGITETNSGTAVLPSNGKSRSGFSTASLVLKDVGKYKSSMVVSYMYEPGGKILIASVSQSSSEQGDNK